MFGDVVGEFDDAAEVAVVDFHEVDAEDAGTRDSCRRPTAHPDAPNPAKKAKSGSFVSS